MSEGPRDHSNVGKSRTENLAEWQKGSLQLWMCGSEQNKLCPQGRADPSESKTALMLSFGDVLQLERLMMGTLMAFKLPLKT